MGDENKEEPAWRIKQREFEQVKARAKNAKLRTTCTICGEKAKLKCPCETTQCAPGAGRDARETVGGRPF